MAALLVWCGRQKGEGVTSGSIPLLLPGGQSMSGLAGGHEYSVSASTSHCKNGILEQGEDLGSQKNITPLFGGPRDLTVWG